VTSSIITRVLFVYTAKDYPYLREVVTEETMVDAHPVVLFNVQKGNDYYVAVLAIDPDLQKLDLIYTLYASPELRITPAPGPGARSLDMTWRGLGYQLQRAADLSQGFWTDIATNPITAGDTGWVRQPADAGLQFYRLIRGSRLAPSPVPNRPVSR